jgi:hypothetical protein
LPITGTTPRKCFEAFREHLAKLLRETVSTNCTVLADVTEASAHIGFRQGDAPIAVPIDTKHGKLFFWVAQLVKAEHPTKREYKLTTLNYWYRLQASGGPKAQALIRWEYDRTLRSGNKPCRHHVQQQATIAIPGAAALDLDKLHIPTGWVTLEEVLRFLIYDLGTKPPCGKTWHKVIEKSEKTFREQFSTPH